MTAWDVFPKIERFERQVYTADSPIDFATWLEFSENLHTELVRGVMVGKMAAQYPHEWIFARLFMTLGGYVMEKELGKVLGSRTAVKITNNDGRLPDLVFIRQDNLSILRHDAIHGTPDLVIEIISENDRPSDLIALEADYRSIAVPEIVFLDPRRKRVRYLRKLSPTDANETTYDEQFLTTGELTLAGVPGFHIEIAWIFAEDKPNPYTLLKQLIEGEPMNPNDRNVA